MKKLHVGCGKNYINGWINCDIDPKVKVDVRIDVRDGLPFLNGSVDYIFNEHFIEHLELEEGKKFLNECSRVLKGVLRVSTPNLQYVVERYLSGRLIEIREWRPATLCDMVNEAMRKWQHKYVYDFNKLRDIMKECGFKNVILCAYRESKHAELKNLECREYNGDLMVEAWK